MIELIVKTVSWVIIAVIVAGPAVAGLGTLFVYVWKERGKGKLPYRDKLLRPPGHSLRKRLDDFQDVFINTVGKLLALGAAIFGIAVLGMKAGTGKGTLWTLVALLAAFVVSVLISWFVGRRVWRGIDRYRNDQLGYRGELCAGQELNELMRNGCFVFHDVPGDGAWNIDHVVVASSGVFAVETKTRSKPINVEGRKNYEVWYDGKELEFPTWKDRHGLEQAEQNARWLSKFLSGAMAESIKAIPVLVLPGWFVSRRPNTPMNAVLVLSLNGARKYLLDYRGPSLTERQMSQIAHHLEQRCRDVEF